MDVPLKKVYLSRKKSLLSTSRVIPTSLAGLEPGMQLEGFIIAVKENGVAVAFCNNIKVSCLAVEVCLVCKRVCVEGLGVCVLGHAGEG